MFKLVGRMGQVVKIGMSLRDSRWESKKKWFFLTVNVSNEEVFQAVIPRREKSKISEHAKTRTATGITRAMAFY